MLTFPWGHLRLCKLPVVRTHAPGTTRFDNTKGTYVCTTCGLENATGADAVYEMEVIDDGSESSYIEIGYWNKEYRDGYSYKAEIDVWLVYTENGETKELLIGGDLCGETVTVGGNTYSPVTYTHGDYIKGSGTVTVDTSNATAIAEALGVTTYTYRIEFMYKTYGTDDYDTNSITIE